MNTTEDLLDLDDIMRALDALVIEPTDTPEANAPECMQWITQDQILAGHSLLKGDRTARTLVGSKEVFRNPDAVAEERAAHARMQAKLVKRRARSMQRRLRVETVRASTPIDPVRMTACLTLLGNLTHVVADLTVQKYNRFRRVLGDVHLDDIAQDSLLRIGESLARSDMDIVVLAQATRWLKSAPQPYVSADGPEGSRQLVGTIERVIGRVIVDLYRSSTTTAWVETVDENGATVWEQRDTTMETLDLVDTVAWNMTGEDDMISHTKASGKAKQKGCAPGMREKRLFARQVIDAAIEARGLGWLATMLLDDERRRADGSFKWTENADTIWAGFEFPAMTYTDPRMKAEKAAKVVRLAFAFLPELIAATYDMITSPEFMWHVGSVPTNRIVMAASAFRPERGFDVDGGTSLAYTMMLTENATARRRALAAIANAESSLDA